MPHRDEVLHIRPHTDDGACGKCRKKFDKGDRVTAAYIVDRVGCDPSNLSRKGVHLYEEFELVHIDCNDPRLTQGIG